MGCESWPNPNEMLIIWPSSYIGTAVALRLSGNLFYADHGFHPHLYPHLGHHQTVSQRVRVNLLCFTPPRPVSGRGGRGVRGGTVTCKSPVQ